MHCMNGLDDQIESVRAEIKALVDAGLKEAVNEQKKKQEVQVHKGFVCDGCEMDPIIGTRYHCTQQEDYDLCEKCEAKGINSQHVMLKIRKVCQAPHSITCKYPEDVNGAQMPDMHIDQAINVDEMAKKF